VEEEKVIVSGSGYNPDMFFPNKNREKNDNVKIAYVGKMCNAKGVPHLLNAIDACKKYEHIELNLIGSGSALESDEIIKSIDSRKTKINYLGIVPQEDLEKLLRTCDLFILPSFFEGLPLVVIEALASGAKVICTDLPGLDDFLGERLKELGAIRYIKMPRLKNVDTPYEEDVCEFEDRLSQTIDEASCEILEGKKYDIDEVIKLLEDKTWSGLFNRLEKMF
jgi:glycosyltransferase involved in cell wall biosynthesis